jgi:PAS domain S-box-containing protein
MSTQVIPDEKREDAATGQIDSKAFSQIIEENYKIIFENTAVAITVTNNEEKLVHWNKFAEALFGMTGDDLYLKPVKELYPETEWGRIRSENIRQQGIQHHMETKVTTVDKGIIDVELSISVLRDHDQRVYGSIGVIKDISDRKKMLQSLEESMELSRGMVETAASAIFLMDEGRFTTVNRVLEEITGYSTKELMGMKREDLLFPG